MRRRGVWVLFSAWAVFGGCDPGDDPADDNETVSGMCSAAVAPPAWDPSFRSNTPGAEVTQTQTDEAQGLVLVSSNYVQDDDDPDALRWWYGEIRNDGPTTICYAKAGVLFQTEDGEVLSAMDLFFDAPPFEGSSDFALPCLAPGEHGIGSGLDASPWTAPLDELATIRVSFDGSVWPGVAPHPLAPSVTSLTPELDDDVSLAGTVCNGESELHFVWIYAYALRDDGLVDFAYDTFYDGTFAPYDDWAFEVSSYGDGTPFSRSAAFVDFTVGPADDDEAGAAAPADLPLAAPGVSSAYRAHHRRLRAARQ